MKLSILYRGPLSSCNYACDYCPFAKHHETAAELAVDRRALERFLDWTASQEQHQISILMTPWGEGLIRRWYQDALVRLTNLPHVPRAVIQTNLSCKLDWVDQCNKDRLALWTTFHPTETTLAEFVGKCRELEQRGVRFSVGTVGLREHADLIAELRAILPPHIYLWINAYKDQASYYQAEEISRFARIDPHFSTNNVRHPSLGKSCRTGASVISVDGDGTIRRCHFIKEPLGNLYETGWEEVLQERPCSNETCGCHIGYVHLDELHLYDLYGGNVLERIPAIYDQNRRDITEWVQSAGSADASA